MADTKERVYDKANQLLGKEIKKEQIERKVELAQVGPDHLPELRQDGKVFIERKPVGDSKIRDGALRENIQAANHQWIRRDDYEY